MTVTLNASEAPEFDALQLRRRELASFLRGRRERITPDQVGLPNFGRRRTPGLRRAELARLAGVGVTWYTWLEQGRPINVSEQVLDAISRVLMLDSHERLHLFVLAGVKPPDLGRDNETLPEGLPVILEKLQPYPAVVTNAHCDILLWNRAFLSLYGDLDALPIDQRNSLWLTFTSPVVRSRWLDWYDQMKVHLVAHYRANMAGHVGEPAWRQLVERLLEVSPEFARLWSDHDVASATNLVTPWSHPELGPLLLRRTNLWIAPGSALRLISYTPEDDATRAALEKVSLFAPSSLY